MPTNIEIKARVDGPRGDLGARITGEQFRERASKFEPKPG